MTLKKFFFLLLLITSYVSAKEIQISKEQLCHFSFTVYKACYQRGLAPGVDCHLLSKGIAFGKAFTLSQVKYIRNTCKTGCFLAKNKFKLQNEKNFVKDCLKKSKN